MMPDSALPSEVLFFGTCLLDLFDPDAGIAAMRLLARLTAVTVVEPADAQACCGFGGTFAVKQPELSAAMAADKAAAVTATGAALLVSQDMGCLMNLDGTLRRAGQGPRAAHIAALLWQRLGAAAPD